MKKLTPYRAMLAVLILGVAGCKSGERRSMTIEIQNDTKVEIAKAQVWAVGSSATKLLVEKSNLAAGDSHRESVKYDLGIKSDGSYELRLREATGNRTVTTGYFTNGSSLDQSLSFRVEKDTVVVKSVTRSLTGY